MSTIKMSISDTLVYENARLREIDKIKILQALP